MARRIISISIILGCLIIGALLLSNNNASAQTSTATPTRTNTIGCGSVIVVTSTPSPTFTPTPRPVTATTTPSCGVILVTATPLVSATPGDALPDLRVVEIGEFTYTTASPTPNAQGCWPGGPLTRIGLRVIIHNDGAGSAGTFAVNLNGSVQTVAGLGANRTVWVDFLGQTLTRTRIATVDSTGLVAETDENNNTMTLNLPGATSTSTGTLPPQNCITKTPTPTGTLITSTPGTGPDLVISGIVYVGSTPTCANQLKERVDISNIGTANAGMFVVTINGIQYQINSLAAGQSTSIVISASMSVTATADSTNLIAESNETNNSASANFPLPSQAPTCTPTGGPSLTPTRTITPGMCMMTTVPIRVSPVTSPTSGLTQVITVTLLQGTSVTVTSQAGSFTSTTPVNNVFSITINLVANSTNNLQVQGTVTPGGSCTPYNLSTTVDTSGNPLTIIQSSTAITLTPTRTPTFTPSPTPVGNTCSPVNATITAPFTKDGVGTFCWQSSNLGSYINNWSMTSVTINGINITNVYTAASSYPAKIGGFWYVTYNGPFSWSHFEAK